MVTCDNSHQQQLHWNQIDNVIFPAPQLLRPTDETLRKVIDSFDASTGLLDPGSGGASSSSSKAKAQPPAAKAAAGRGKAMADAAVPKMGRARGRGRGG